MLDRLLALILGTLLALVKVMPLQWFDPCGAGLAWLIRPFARRDLAHLRRNVHAAFGLPPKTHFSRMFEQQVLRHHLVCGLETLRIIQDPSVMQVVGIEALKLAVAEAEVHGKGHEVITAHLGSWELCAYLGQQAASRPFHVLAKPPKHPVAVTFLNGVRKKMGVQILWTDRKSILKDMLSALKRGESIGFVMDQKPQGRQGPVVPFFGMETEFVSGPAAMAVRTGCAVIGLFCVREGPFRYRAVTKPLLPANHGETNEDALTGKMAATIEGVIRDYPEQWTWNYKRWRTPRLSS